MAPIEHVTYCLRRRPETPSSMDSKVFAISKLISAIAFDVLIVSDSSEIVRVGIRDLWILFLLRRSTAVMRTS